MDFRNTPALYFVVATALPLASFLLIFLASGLWCLARRYRSAPGMEALYQVTGGDRPGPLPAYVALGAIALAFVASAAGFVQYMRELHAQSLTPTAELHGEIHELEKKYQKAEDKKEKKELHDQIEEKEKALTDVEGIWQSRQASAWKGQLLELVRVRPFTIKDGERGTSLSVGYHIDSLAALMFVMVTFVASLIHLFSMGYMKEEEAEQVEDHHVFGHHHHAVGAETPDPVHGHHAHYTRRGRFGRFFMYLSLFCFSMLNLVLANNLFQVFISWELVGICSYLLIGFYFERHSAANAANKAFITNRVGDAGFILGLLIVFGYLGTFNFDEMFRRVRSMEKDSHGHLRLAGQVVRATPVPSTPDEKPTGERVLRVTLPGEKEQGSEVVLFPRQFNPKHFHGLGPRESHEGDDHEPEMEVTVADNPGPRDYSSMPYWMLVAAGLGIFLGCVGKSAQFPLQVWLPDAMEGPTPVSALIHAATMVAAGVYLVGRVYPLFTPEVLLTIAYIGGITLFVAATIAVVMTDIKKVLAYSTVSQLGYMMLALGVGGWSAGLFHLFTHAFFKALLFLGSGAVIYGCHHEQEMTKMGGLYPKMKITALTMLMGVLAIAGTPLFSGWHSKDAVVAQALGFAAVNPHHALLFVLPLATAGITTFYMFRMWFLTFTGEPRDAHVHEHAHEAPWTMTAPLVVLAVLAVCVSWGNRPWNATESHLEDAIHHSQPASVLAEFGHVEDHHEHFPAIAARPAHQNARAWAHRLHDLAGYLALGVAAIGFAFAFAVYYVRALNPQEAKEQFPAVHAFLTHKWYFDELYSVALVRPAVVVSRAFAAFDLRRIDGLIHAVAAATTRTSRASGWFDNRIVDALVNVIGSATYALGTGLRGLQTGSLRSYVLFLVLAAIAVFAALSYFVSLAPAG